MARLYITSGDGSRRQEIPFEVFVELFKGIAVGSAASGYGFLELGLTNQFNVAFLPGRDGELELIIRSTVNRGEIPSATFFLAASDEDLTAAQMEGRLFALRQLYALYVMTSESMSGELALVARNGLGVDYEQQLLPRDFQVRITSVGPGSLIAVATAVASRGRAYVQSFFASFYPQGRQALLDTVRANADLKQIEVEQKGFDLNFHRVNSLIELSKRIEEMPDGRTKERLRQQLEGSLGNLASSSFTPTRGSQRRIK